MDRSISRVGAWAGVLSLIGILGYHLGLMAVAGQRASGTADAASIATYYRHPGIADFSVEGFLILITMLVFAVALRTTLSTTPWTRFLTSVALVAVSVELAVLMVQTALQAALVATARAGGDVTGLFRFWDVLYNSGAYTLEATWVVCFGLAARSTAGFPRWLPRFSVVTSALLAVNVTAIWIGIPDAATLPSSLFLAVWFGATSFGLLRTGAAAAAPASYAATASTPSPAG